jgi:hypothetical protein
VTSFALAFSDTLGGAGPAIVVAIVLAAIAVAVERQAYQPEPVKVVGWL